MGDSIYGKIKKRIELAEEGTIFVTTNFADIANATTIRKYLGRQVEEKNIRRVLNGVYEKPVYSKLLKEFVPTNPDAVAHSIARRFHWTIAPCGDVALNKLGLSTQIPVVWSYVSDGPYREYSWDNIRIVFKHRANREISLMTENSILLVEAVRTLGIERIDENIICRLRNRLPENEKEALLKKTAGVSEWVYEVIKKVCL